MCLGMLRHCMSLLSPRRKGKGEDRTFRAAWTGRKKKEKEDKKTLAGVPFVNFLFLIVSILHSLVASLPSSSGGKTTSSPDHVPFSYLLISATILAAL